MSFWDAVLTIKKLYQFYWELTLLNTCYTGIKHFKPIELGQIKVTKNR